MAQDSFDSLILGIENPLLDISVNADDALYKRYDLPLEATVLIEEKHMPIFKDIKEKYKPKYAPGGSTQNTLRAAQVFYVNVIVVIKPEVSLFMLFYGKCWR